VTISDIITSIVALPLLLYLPGWAVARVLSLAPADWLEAAFERVAMGALWSGWLALLLGALGVFSLGLHLALTLLLCALCVFSARRLHSDSITTRSSAPSTPSAVGKQTVTQLAYAAVLLLALLLVVRPFEVVLGVRDAGVYANAGFAMARHGSLIQDDTVLAGLGQDALSSNAAVSEPAAQALSNFTIAQPRDRYIATRLRAAGFFVNEGDTPEGRVVPQGLHLLPAWIALLTAVGGPYLGLFAPGLLGVLGVWSVGMLGRRLAGAWVGGLAMLLLALNGVQIWFARYSTAETVAQFLIFAGLYFFCRMADETKHRGREGRREAELPEPSVPFASLRSHSGCYGLLAGIAMGQVALARIDFFLLGPVVLYLGYRWFTRRWAAGDWALLIGLGALLIHAALHIVAVARAYFFDTGFERVQDFALTAWLALPFLSEGVRAAYLSDPQAAMNRPLRVVLEITLVTLALGGLLALRQALVRLGDRSPLLRFEHWLRVRQPRLLTITMVAILLLGAYTYLVRPRILTTEVLAAAPACLMPDQLRTPTGPCLTLQGYIGAPIALPDDMFWYSEYDDMSWWQIVLADESTFTSEPVRLKDKYMIPLANLVRVGWYLSPLGIALGIVGYALWWRNGLTRASWLFLVVAFLGTFFYVRQTYGTSDQTYIYILRRFVPICYPAFSLAMAYAVVAIAGGFRRQKLGDKRQETPVGAKHCPGRPTATEPLPSVCFALVWRVEDRMQHSEFSRPNRLAFARLVVASVLGAGLVSFFAVTARPITAHTEYRGALNQLSAIAEEFTPGSDVLLLRGGGPVHAVARDVPDLIATPLRFMHDIDAFTVKSVEPGSYADQLTAAVQRWRSQGRDVYVLLSASGAGLAFPGFALDHVGDVDLDLVEFEQLTDQKPRNVAGLTLPFAIYRLAESTPGQIAAPAPPLTPSDFAAQVRGFYRPEHQPDSAPYAWTDGDALLRLPWDGSARRLTIAVAGGERPAHLGAAELCLSALPETAPWPQSGDVFQPVSCITLSEELQTFTIELPDDLLATARGALLLRLESPAWVPAVEDPRQNDQRSVGVQFGALDLAPAGRIP
jgi:hypothetical protein